MKAGNLEESEKVLRRAVAIYGRDPNILCLLGEVLLRTVGDPVAARPVLEEALATQREWDAREHPSLAADTTAARLAQCLVLLGETTAALDVLEREARRGARPEALLDLRARLAANPDPFQTTTRDGG